MIVKTLKKSLLHLNVGQIDTERAAGVLSIRANARYREAQDVSQNQRTWVFRGAVSIEAIAVVAQSKAPPSCLCKHKRVHMRFHITFDGENPVYGAVPSPRPFAVLQPQSA